MRIDIGTPALLFPAISLLMLAYTNRFLALASIIRNLHRSHTEKPNPVYVLEIENLRTRIRLIRDMQSFGVLSLILCMACMFLIFRGYHVAGEWVFGASLIGHTHDCSTPTRVASRPGFVVPPRVLKP